MQTVTVNASTRYEVLIEKGLLSRTGELTANVFAPSRSTAAIITDDTVAGLYLRPVVESLKAAGFRICSMDVPHGEDSKSHEVLLQVYDFLIQNNITRSDFVVALGGGVVGDLAGFAAATYLRGIPFVQIPTTFLAAIDSSVGGKTAINLEAGKNLVGAFKQPSYVCADTDTLATLPEREWRCGCAEVAKSAVIDSDEFFFWMADHAVAIAAREAEAVSEAIARCVVFKADVVAMDKTESKGVRECLNYGHTLGHAVEKLAGYGTFTHGEGVAEGMRFAARMAIDLVGAAPEFVEAQDELLDALGLPPLAWSAEPEALLDAMKRDKKARGGHVRFVLPRDVGEWELVEVDDAVAGVFVYEQADHVASDEACSACDHYISFPHLIFRL